MPVGAHVFCDSAELLSSLRKQTLIVFQCGHKKSYQNEHSRTYKAVINSSVGCIVLKKHIFELFYQLCLNESLDLLQVKQVKLAAWTMA